MYWAKIGNGWKGLAFEKYITYWLITWLVLRHTSRQRNCPKALSFCHQSLYPISQRSLTEAEQICGHIFSFKRLITWPTTLSSQSSRTPPWQKRLKQTSELHTAGQLSYFFKKKYDNNPASPKDSKANNQPPFPGSLVRSPWYVRRRCARSAASWKRFQGLPGCSSPRCANLRSSPPVLDGFNHWNG